MKTGQSHGDMFWCRIAAVAAVSLAIPVHAAAGDGSDNVDLLGRLTLAQMGSAGATDCWGYVSPSGREYAIMALVDKTSIIEISDPTNPTVVGEVSHAVSLADAKVYQHYVYVSNGRGGGIDIIDLDDVDNGNVTLVQRMTEGGVDHVHNIAIDEDSGFLYLGVGNINSGKITAFDLSDPENPVVAGVYDGSRAHDLQVITYVEGPYAGREIAFSFSESRGMDIIDVTDKSDMFLLSRSTYPGLRYCHQGWADATREHVYINDELDGIQRTTVFDITDLEDPVHLGDFNSTQEDAVDHNLYIHNGFAFEANYTSGLRIFDLNQDPVSPPETGYFDTSPLSGGGFRGAWSCYPYYPSGVVIVSDREEGLFVLDPSAAVDSRATLTDLTMVEGAETSGGLAELATSDDLYYATVHAVTGEAAETHRLQYIVGSETNRTAGDQITITCEGRSDDSMTIVTLFMRNWNGGFEQVAQFGQGLTDSSETIDINDANRFIRESDGRIELRVKKHIVLPSALAGTPSFDDLIEISVE